MLYIKIPDSELYDEVSEEFINVKDITLRLEHSLVSISKWEAEWKKPFFKPGAVRTHEESKHYVQCMTLNQNVNPIVYDLLTAKDYSEINAYIDSDRTATWFSDQTKSTSRDVITSELIYYWMVAHQIPWEAQKWHISRLLTLIRICNIKNAPEKKMSKREILSRNKALNAARRAKLKTSG